MNPHLCGTLPSRDHAAVNDRTFRSQALSASASNTEALRLITRWNTWLRNQQTPSCLGHSLITMVETQVGDKPRLSGVSLWREGRRLQGRIEQIDEGLRVEHGIAALYSRGWSDPWRPGEETDPVEAGLGANDAGDDPLDELNAYDTIHRVRSERILESALGDITNAIDRSLAVLWAGGVKDPFGSLRTNQVATTDHLGGYRNGHAMVIVGYHSTPTFLRFLMRNSWGPNWGGAIVNGVTIPGLFWADAGAVLCAWEHHVIYTMPTR